MDITNNEDNVEMKKKKKSKWKLILLIIFVVIPLAIMITLYNNNINFKANINKRLSKMPGAIGEHFKNYPTESEKNVQIEYLSNYFVNLEPNIAADKIYIIKKEDEKLYIDLIRGMNSISTGKTEEVVLKVRNLELRKDLLFSVHDGAQQDEKDNFLSEVSRMERQDILTTILEVEKRFADREFLKILNEIKLEKMGEILYYADPDIKNYIVDSFQIDRKIRIEGILYEKTNEENMLKDIAKLYETKPLEVSLKAIGNIENYPMEKLGTIYKNLSVLKSAELLLNIEDENFVDELFTAIMREEQLTKSNTNITSDISQSIEFLNEYQTRINDLVSIYEKMSPDKVARIVEKMMINTETITSFELNAEEVYALSDSVIIVDVLSKMKNQTLSKVFDFMEAEKASKITQLLAKPKENS